MEYRKTPGRTLVAATSLVALAAAGCGFGGERGTATAAPATADPGLSYPISPDFFSGATPLDCNNRPQSVASTVDTEPEVPHKAAHVLGLVESYLPDGKPVYSKAVVVLGMGALEGQVVTSDAPEGPGQVIDLNRGPHTEIIPGDRQYDIGFSAEIVPYGDDQKPAARYSISCVKPLQPKLPGDEPHYGGPSQSDTQNRSPYDGLGPLHLGPNVQ